MKRKDIYVGKLKKCIDLNKFEKYGEDKFFPEMESLTMQMGIREYYYEEIYNTAIFIKVGIHLYLCLNYAVNKIDNALLNLDLIPATIYSNKPTEKNLYYVDEKSLKPYFNSIKEGKNISVKSLKLTTLTDPRLPGGIEH